MHTKYGTSLILRYFNAKGASAEEYAELLTEAYKVIKKNAPDALVVGCAPAEADKKFIAVVLEAGGGDYMDAISVHYYLGTISRRVLHNIFSMI